MFTSRIINNTAHPIRRGSVELSIGYNEELGRVIQVLLAAVPESEGVSPERGGAVRVSALGPEDVLLEVTFWTDSRRSDFKDTASQVRRNVLEALKRSAVALPEPNRIIVEHRGSNNDA